MTTMPTSVKGHPPLTWGLCVATLNRLAELEDCVRCALAQTRPLSEIVIVDASADWERNRDRIGELVQSSGVRLQYIPAARKSSAAQRNQGIAASTADVLFLIDDDSFMYPDCAAHIMSNIACFAAKNSDRPDRHYKDYRRYARRRLLAEFLKDTLSGRLTFPQLRGAFAGIRRSNAVFGYKGNDLAQFYDALQREILSI